MSGIFQVAGMSCGGCVSSVEQAIKAVAPEAIVEVMLDAGLVKVEGLDDNDLVRQAVEDAGFTFEGEA
jgi:copper chaperone